MHEETSTCPHDDDDNDDDDDDDDDGANERRWDGQQENGDNEEWDEDEEGERTAYGGTVRRDKPPSPTMFLGEGSLVKEWVDLATQCCCGADCERKVRGS